MYRLNSIYHNLLFTESVLKATLPYIKFKLVFFVYQQKHLFTWIIFSHNLRLLNLWYFLQNLEKFYRVEKENESINV